VPAIPISFDDGYYPQGINYYSLREETPSFYRYPDKKVNSMLDELISALKSAGYQVHEKVLVSGFSAGGMWANRYTVLHPERVQAAAIGQSGGWLTVPFESYDNTTLNWPLGLADYEQRKGQVYEKTEELKDIPQFVYIGSDDTDATYYSSTYPEESELTIWGASDPERLETQATVLSNRGYNVTFQLYDGVGHTITESMYEDVWNFLESHM
jgi:predicted esterase